MQHLQVITIVDFPDVGAAGKGLVPGAADDYSLYGVIRPCHLHGRADVPPHCGGKRIARLRPVQRQV